MSAKNKNIKASIPLAQMGKVGDAKQFNKPVSLSWQYIEVGSTYCLSNCDQQQVKLCMDCLRRLTTLIWSDVLRSGGGNKSGLAYTYYEDHALKKAKRPDCLSLDVKIAALRVSDRFRVFGFYLDHIFYILWFDRNHEIVPFRKHVND